jgi:hypothetical protein
VNLEFEILKEHSKAQTLKIAKYIGSDAQRFADLMNHFLNGSYTVTQRAAWIIHHSTKNDPSLIVPYIQSMIENLKKPVHDAVKRNTMRAFQFIEIPEELMGITTEACFNLLGSKNEPVAIKVFSMTVLFNICQKEPDLKNELKMYIEEQLPYSSAAFKSRGSKILKALNKIRTA